MSEGIALPKHMQGFDDHQIKRQYCLQQRFRQKMPLALSGGREALWWCPQCRSAWYERGHCPRSALLHLSPAYVSTVARALFIESRNLLNCLPRVMCPDCATHCLGGVPQIEEFPTGYGYRLTWERARSPVLFLCTVYTGPLLPDTVHVALSSASDLPLASSARVQALLDWLIVYSDPAWDHIIPLDDEQCAWLDRRYQPPAQFTWSGYVWNPLASPLGTALVIMAMTFSREAHCSPAFLVACWRHIAQGMRSIL